MSKAITRIPFVPGGSVVTILRKAGNHHWNNPELFALYDAGLPILIRQGSEKVLVMGKIDLSYKDPISDFVGTEVSLEVFSPDSSQRKSYSEQFRSFRPSNP